MHDPGIATAADYADAMMSARRAKNVLVLLLVLVLLGQLAVFFLVRYNVMSIAAPATTTDVAAATTQPARVNWTDVWHYITGACLFAGVALPIVLSFVLLLIVNIMLVGRLIGVARLTSAYIWCLVLLVLLFPWQAFLNQVGLTPAQAPWKWPGALYTWYEFTNTTQGAKFPSNPIDTYSILKWWRYVGMPLVSLIILLAIQVKSNRGMRQALGEDEPLPGSSAATDTTAA
jgi:hypothetical protein